MVLTRSRSNTTKASTASETPASAATIPVTTTAAPSKRKRGPSAAESAAKTTKAEGTADVAEAKAASAETAPPALAAPDTTSILAPIEVPALPARAPVVASEEEPSVHHVKEAHARESIHPYEVVVSDIEGTTTPIVFVKENLVSELCILAEMKLIVIS